MNTILWLSWTRSRLSARLDLTAKTIAAEPPGGCRLFFGRWVRRRVVDLSGSTPRPTVAIVTVAVSVASCGWQTSRFFGVFLSPPPPPPSSTAPQQRREHPTDSHLPPFRRRPDAIIIGFLNTFFMLGPYSVKIDLIFTVPRMAIDKKIKASLSTTLS